MITPTQAKLGGSTYQVSAISSVELRVEPPSIVGPAILVLLGFLAAFFGSSFLLVFVFDPTVEHRSVGGAMFGLVTVVGVAVAALAAWWGLSQGPSHAVLIGTTAGTKRALVTPDRQRAERVAAALNSALQCRPGD